MLFNFFSNLLKSFFMKTFHITIVLSIFYFGAFLQSTEIRPGIILPQMTTAHAIL
jgi:hypothetical protein